MPPAAPTALTATVQSGPQVALQWTDNADNEDGFVVERSATGAAGSFVQIGTAPASAGTGTTSFDDTTVAAGTSYWYRVAAFKQLGSAMTMSDYSEIVGVAVPAVPFADFSADVVSVTAGDSVTFTDLSSNAPTDWAWTFDGGTPASSSAQHPVVVYATPGTFAVSLTASNVSGSDTVTKTGFITVQPVGCAASEWSVDWFDGTALAGPVAGSQCVSSIDLNFGSGGPAAAASVGVNTFSGRFTKTVNLTAGTYRFTTTSDDGVRVLVDNNPVIDHWVNQSSRTWTGQVTLGAGNHTIVVEYYENTGSARIQADYEVVP
jgi:PKD repeat protein